MLKFMVQQEHNQYRVQGILVFLLRTVHKIMGFLSLKRDRCIKCYYEV